MGVKFKAVVQVVVFPILDDGEPAQGQLLIIVIRQRLVCGVIEALQVIKLRGCLFLERFHLVAEAIIAP